jgi:SAM-dependent methyltransferase
MESLFASAEMARGYAAARPAVHGLILQEVWQALGPGARAERALDVGCGSGLSTRELLPVCGRCFGVEPAVSMLQLAREVAPGAGFVAGGAERLPFSSGVFGLITAAGSLNFCDVEGAFPELLRVLEPGGRLVVYDFSPGRRMRGSRALGEWIEEFQRRYPPPAHAAVTLDPERLAELARGFVRGPHARFEGGLTLDVEFYARYMMTETNVADAVRHGADAGEIRGWVETTLRPVFAERPREVLFDGYWAVFEKPSSATTRPAP